jgi:MoaA/NifB/PqqE/SkfB family radical SAM enzyme
LYPSSACNSKCIICPFRFRHENPYFIPLETVKGIIDFMHGQTPRPKALSVIISGDGEPTLHPSIGSILGYMHERDIRVFLTSNLVMPSVSATDKLKAIADNVSMLTVSIKGLSVDSYKKYQGKDAFYRVMENLEKLVGMLEANGRRKDVLFGIASLILPENTGYYQEMVGRFVELGLDYVYLNVVEPSYQKWGIDFSEQLRQQTLDELDSLDQFNGSGTMIRYSKELFNGTTGQSVYFDANGRYETSICGSALWNPLFMTEDRRTSMIACRSSDKFHNEDFIFGQTDDAKNMGDLTLPSNIARVMSNTSKCFNCRLERQVRLFDDLIRIEQTYGYGGEFVLNFKQDVVESKIGTTVFESTFKRNK